MSDEQKILAVVDDHPIVSEGMKHLLSKEERYQSVLSFFNAQSFLSFITHQKVDIVLLDMLLPDGNGVDLCKEIKLLHPEICILGMSNLAERSTVLSLLQHGASGYILKSAPAAEILNSIELAQRGEIVLSPEIKKLMTDVPAENTRKLPGVTKREKQLLELLAAGKTTTVIAAELSLTRFTVDTYRKNLLQKFGVKNTTELLMLVVQEKLI
ncbi:response regulator transcription factor [Chitinophaga sp. Mgbs1]|uniref:Response regulator transcription factor n=1 Tax=Chitinophaga solisilvae TaxID=1233460 RepID=A0A3S1BHR0_9BACT|nr:response regulator transcription factor [Chitinophaga solisilvae]